MIVQASGHVGATSHLAATVSVRVAAEALMKPVKSKRSKTVASAVATVRQR